MACVVCGRVDSIGLVNVNMMPEVTSLELFGVSEGRTSSVQFGLLRFRLTNDQL